ncbi:MAG TPA: hypothetical protein VMI54_10100 [Polyangiaceae bacterium]|nr:hypothetical protein [Polyangiaceae bacterium]
MRRFVWCGLIVALAACGKSRAHSPSTQGPGTGGVAGATAGAGAAAGSAVTEAGGGESGASAGGTGGTSGRAGGNGGAAASGGTSGRASSTAGSAGTTSGGRTNAGGSGGAAGTAGAVSSTCTTNDAGAAGAGDAECGEYLECGCGGCCTTVTMDPQSRCYFPEVGESVAELRCEDEAARAAPTCMNQACSSGLLHVCCVRDPDTGPDKDGGYVANIDTSATPGYTYLSITRTDASGEDSGIELLETPGGNPFPLSVPAGFSTLSFYDSVEGIERPVIGVIGSLDFGAGPGETLDVDFTLFALGAGNTIVKVRFKAKDVPIQTI